MIYRTAPARRAKKKMITLGRGYYGTWNGHRRGLGRVGDATTVNSGDIAPPDPNLLAQELGPAGQGIGTQANLTQAVVQDANAQIAADNITTPFFPRLAFVAGQVATGNTSIAGMSVPNLFFIGAGGLLLTLALISGRGKRR